jgi:hypothetical protein
MIINPIILRNLSSFQISNRRILQNDLLSIPPLQHQKKISSSHLEVSYREQQHNGFGITKSRAWSICIVSGKRERVVSSATTWVLEVGPLASLTYDRNCAGHRISDSCFREEREFR